MAEYYGYFNGLEYDEKFVALVNSILVKNGVFDDGLMVSVNSGITVDVASGSAIIDGFIYHNDSPKALTLETANASLPRIDSIMLRWNISGRTMNAVVVTGTPQSNPSAPAPVRNSTTYDFQLATVQINAGVDSITAANITDTRPDDMVCGITSGYNSVDIDAMMTQYNAQFDEWFNQIKGQLSEDAAGNLQNQINTINTELNGMVDKIYPVGSVYTSVNNVNPSSLFGGTWVSFASGRTLIGVDTAQTEFNTVQKTGGEKTHTLTTTEIPSHTHMMIGTRSIPEDSSGPFKTPWSDGNPINLRSTGSTGGGQAHNNLPPYITVYFWLRTA